MSSLSELPEVIGFFSYSREDDEAFKGTLSALRDAIQRELSAQLGRNKRNFRLWQDQEAIAPGRLWESEITTAVEQAVFLIPIVTPRAVSSQYCKFEFTSFLAREHALGRDDLVFPIYYISIPALEDEAKWRNDPVLSIVAKRQYVDWRAYHFLPVNTTAVGTEIERFCSKVVEALREPWLSPEERAHQELIAAQRRAEEERIQLETEAKRLADEKARRKQREAEAARLAEEERRAKKEAEAARLAEEERRRRAEAEAARKAQEERRKREEAEARHLFEEERRRRDETAAAHLEDERRVREEADAARVAEEERGRPEAAEAAREVEEESRIAAVAAEAAPPSSQGREAEPLVEAAEPGTGSAATSEIAPPSPRRSLNWGNVSMIVGLVLIAAWAAVFWKVRDSNQYVTSHMTIHTTIDDSVGAVRSVAFSPDGRSVVSGSNSTLKLWEAATGRLMRTFGEHPGLVSSVTFSPDGRTILSGSIGGSLKLWDGASGRLIREFEVQNVDVFSVAFSPDGGSLLAGTRDDKLKLWDAGSGRLIHTFEGHRDIVVWSVAFSPDRHSLLSGGYVRLWDAESELLPIRHFQGTN